MKKGQGLIPGHYDIKSNYLRHILPSSTAKLITPNLKKEATMELLTCDLDTSNGISTVITRHREVSNTWYVRPYNRSKYCKRDGLFKIVNDYMKTLTELENESINVVYGFIHETINEEPDSAVIKAVITDSVTELYEIIDVERLNHYVRFMTDIRLPDNLAESCVETEQNIIDRTYIRSDYVGLVVLTVALKFMLPIWGSYMARMSALTDNPFKEYDAIGILINTALIRGENIERLRTLISALTANHNMPLSAQLAGLGTSEMPEYLLALAVVRRLTLSPADVQPESGHLIAQVYRDVEKNISTSLDKTFNGRVKEKHPSGDSDDEDRASRAESYKEKQVISDGDRVSLNTFARNLKWTLPKVVGSDVPAKLVADIKAEVMAIPVLDLKPPQRALISWVMMRLQPDGTPALSYIGTRFLDRKAIRPAMICTKVALHMWGLGQLAAFITATAENHQHELSTLLGGSPPRLDKKAIERLLELYPYHITDATTRALSKSEYESHSGDAYTAQDKTLHTSRKKSNPARKGIDELTDLIGEYTWTRCPHAIKCDDMPEIVNGSILIPARIRFLLMDLLLRVNNVTIQE